MSIVENLERMLAGGRDGAALRYGLASAYLEQGEPDRALAHLEAALGHDPAYSAAWKLYGRTLAEAGRADEARDAWRRGIEAAGGRGDVQAAKEMQVFLRRLERDAGA